jgi:molecular chaperone Hsp33
VRQRAGRAPYSGIVPLTTGTIAQDLTHYLAESEQIHSAIGLGVFLTQDGVVEAAGGFSVHALPDADDEEIELAEANVRGFPGPGELVREGVDANGIIDHLLAGLGSRDHHSSPAVFHCGCDRDRVIRAVGLLEREELETSVQDAESIEVCCQFCAERYRVSPNEIQAMLADRGSS